MWLFTKNSFVSVVVVNGDSSKVMIRARNRESLNEIHKLYSGPFFDILESPKADYPFRVVLSKEDFCEMLTEYVHTYLHYSNFKAAQTTKDSSWMPALHNVWRTMINTEKDR